LIEYAFASAAEGEAKVDEAGPPPRFASVNRIIFLVTGTRARGRHGHEHVLKTLGDLRDRT